MNSLLNMLKELLASYPPWVYSAAVACGLLLAAFVVNFITKYILLRGLRKLLKALPASDAEERRLRLSIISRLANIVPALVLSYGAAAIPDVHDTLETVIRNVCNAFIVLTSVMALTRILDLIEIIYRRRPDAASKPIKERVSSTAENLSFRRGCDSDRGNADQPQSADPALGTGRNGGGADADFSGYDPFACCQHSARNQ